MEMGVTNNVDYLESLLQVLTVQGEELISPHQRQNLHPLIIPLSEGQSPADSGKHGEDQGQDAGISADLAVTGLLRWPITRPEGMSVVRMRRGAGEMRLVARSAREYLTRALAQEDCGQGNSIIADTIGAEASSLYTKGQVGSSGMPSLDAWLTKQGCMFPDVLESLVHAHLDRGDKMSAMIASEWYMKRAHFPGWARPYEFNAMLYKKLNREEEARDSARVALYTPWWTLRCGFHACAQLAQFPTTGVEVHQILSEVMKRSEGGPLPAGIAVATKTDQQLALEEAEQLMNSVASGEATWDGIKPALAAKYEEGEQRIIADFIRAAIISI